MKKYFFLFLLILVLLIAGCGGECKENSDCDDGNGCTTDRCIDKECVHRPIPDCTCGDNKCDDAKGEDECTCPEDCGRCRGKVGEYFEKSCNEDNVCVVSVAGQKQEIETAMIEAEERRVTLARMAATYTYDSPFNIDESMMNIKYSLDTKETGITNLKIDKVQLLAVEGRMIRGEYPTSSIIGEVKDVNRILWDEYSEVEANVIIDSLMIEEEAGEQKTVVVKTIYTYDTVDNRGNPTTLSRAHLSPEISVAVVNPSKQPECPPVEDWDDGNECTLDSCSAATNYFVKHEMKRGQCIGNYICEAGENKCTAPMDCGRCEGYVGEYLRLECENNKCISKMINPDVIEQKKIVDELSIPSATREDIKFAVTKLYDEPFDMSQSVLILNLEVLRMSETLSNFKIARMQLLEGNNELGVAEVNQGFNSVGEEHDLAVGTDFSLPELQAVKQPVLKIYYSYDSVDRLGNPISYVNEALEISLPDITFINADAEV